MDEPNEVRIELQPIEIKTEVFAPSVRIVSATAHADLGGLTASATATVTNPLDVVEGVGVIGDGSSVYTTRSVPIASDVTMLVHDVDGNDPEHVSGIGHPDDYLDNIDDD